MTSHNKTIKVAFDVDGTLIEQVGDKADTPRYSVISLFKSYQNLGCEMYIWSGGGVDYAAHWARKLGLDAIIVVKGSFVPDIAFDDCEITLGKTNIQV